MRRAVLISMFAVVAVGCAGADRHLYLVEPINVIASTAEHPKIGLLGKPIGEGAKEPAQEKGPDVGNWFVRQVFHPDQDRRTLYALGACREKEAAGDRQTGAAM